MRPPIEFLFPQELGADMLYSFVIIICSLMIYFSTKEMYELSSYKGIKYFRQTFLFFAIAYFSRYFILFFLAFFNINSIFWISPRIIFNISMMVFLYSSSMAVFSLLYSVMWKEWRQSKYKIYIFNAFAILIACLGIIFRGLESSLLLNVLFFIFVAIILFLSYKNSKIKQKGKGLFVIYFLLFIFFFLNILNTLVPEFLQLYKIGIYLSSIFLFMYILYRVLKKTGN